MAADTPERLRGVLDLELPGRREQFQQLIPPAITAHRSASDHAEQPGHLGGDRVAPGRNRTASDRPLRESSARHCADGAR